MKTEELLERRRAEDQGSSLNARATMLTAIVIGAVLAAALVLALLQV